VNDLVQSQSQGLTPGSVGQERVNVLEVHRALDVLSAGQTPGTGG